MFGTKKATVAVLSIDGVIRYEDHPLEGFQKLMKQFEKVSAMKPAAMILRINSPGGTVAASQEIYREIKEIRNQGVKVVALMEDVAASGGLYVAMAADKIVANPGTVTGSIGVILQGVEFSKIIKKLGIGVHVIKSGEHKDIMSPARKMTKKEELLLQEVVRDVFNQFCRAVSLGRGINEETIKSWQGRIMSGQQARQLGLVDEIGSFKDALVIAKELAGIASDDVKIEIAIPRLTFMEKLGMRLDGLSFLKNSAMDNKLASTPLWLMPRF